MKIDVDATHSVSGIAQIPADPIASLVLGHGAGAGMRHPFMTAVADALLARRIATFRYQFPYMEAGARLPDRPPLACATVRAAVDAARRALPDVPLFAGGKSFGARMTSLAQAEAPLAKVAGLVFIGFPLHPAGKLSTDRAAHLVRFSEPLLFLQGTRDVLADLATLAPVIAGLGERATLVVAEQADHAFRVPAKSARTSAEVLHDLLDHTVAWMERVMAGSR